MTQPSGRSCFSDWIGTTIAVVGASLQGPFGTAGKRSWSRSTSAHDWRVMAEPRGHPGSDWSSSITTGAISMPGSTPAEPARQARFPLESSR